MKKKEAAKRKIQLAADVASKISSSDVGTVFNLADYF